jgi:hypothetical protein
VVDAGDELVDARASRWDPKIRRSGVPVGSEDPFVTPFRLRNTR